jgi:hypothetical protein
MASAIAALAVIFGLKNNVLTMLFSIPFERALFYHKAAAALGIVLAAIHGALAIDGRRRLDGGEGGGEGGDDENTSGFILIGLMGVASMSYVIP